MGVPPSPCFFGGGGVRGLCFQAWGWVTYPGTVAKPASSIRNETPHLGPVRQHEEDSSCSTGFLLHCQRGIHCMCRVLPRACRFRLSYGLRPEDSATKQVAGRRRGRRFRQPAFASGSPPAGKHVEKYCQYWHRRIRQPAFASGSPPAGKHLEHGSTGSRACRACHERGREEHLEVHLCTCVWNLRLRASLRAVSIK